MNKLQRNILITLLTVLFIVGALLIAIDSQAETCDVLVTKDLDTLRIEDTDYNGNTHNVRGYLLYKQNVKEGTRFKLDSNYGNIHLHYQTHEASGPYGEFNKSCDRNTIRIP